MKKLSEESLLLIRNWNAYEDIVRAGERLKAEVSAVLFGIEERLKREKWWNNDWLFRRDTPVQCYITHRKWVNKDTDLIWIGIEYFTAEGLFGSSDAPSMYVWIDGRRPTLKADLTRIIQESGKPVMGEFDMSQQSRYVVQKTLIKCLPEEVDSFEEKTLTPLMEFLSFYAQFCDEFSDAVGKYLKSGE